MSDDNSFFPLGDGCILLCLGWKYPSPYEEYMQDVLIAINAIKDLYSRKNELGKLPESFGKSALMRALDEAILSIKRVLNDERLNSEGSLLELAVDELKALMK